MHTLAGISCATAINLADYSSPIINMASSFKTNFQNTCGQGFDAVYYYSLPGATNATIRFYAPSTTYYHTDHEIRYQRASGGSCPGDTSIRCSSASSWVGLTNIGSTSLDVYYIQSGFTSANSDLNVQWTVTDGE